MKKKVFEIGYPLNDFRKKLLWFLKLCVIQIFQNDLKTFMGMVQIFL